MAGFLFVVFHPRSFAFGRRAALSKAMPPATQENGASWRCFLPWLAANAPRKTFSRLSRFSRIFRFSKGWDTFAAHCTGGVCRRNGHGTVHSHRGSGNRSGAGWLGAVAGGLDDLVEQHAG